MPKLLLLLKTESSPIDLSIHLTLLQSPSQPYRHILSPLAVRNPRAYSPVYKPLDLLHLASTCSELYTLIRRSEPVFNRLKRLCLCDSHGLKIRQDFKGTFALKASDFRWGRNRRAHYDELEVRV